MTAMPPRSAQGLLPGCVLERKREVAEEPLVCDSCPLFTTRVADNTGLVVTWCVRVGRKQDIKTTQPPDWGRGLVIIHDRVHVRGRTLESVA